MRYNNPLLFGVQFKAYESEEEGYIGLIVVGDEVFLSSQPNGPRLMPRPIRSQNSLPLVVIPSPSLPMERP